MPIPKPRDSESKNEFIERCMSNETMQEEYDQEQRAAICNKQWENRNDGGVGQDGNANRLHASRPTTEIGADTMEKQLRVDQAEIKDWRYDEKNEVLTADVLMTKSQVLPYKNSGETVHELLPPDELARDSWLESIKSKSVTNLHPDEEVNYQNIGDLSKGSLHNNVWTERDGDTVEVWATETIYDEDLIQDIREGKKEQVSIGRFVNVVDESGEFGGVKYDKKQTDFELNHLAHVPQGRAGQDVKVRLDGDMLTLETEESGETNSDKENTTDSRQEGINMNLTIGDKKLALDEDLKDEDLESFQDEIDERLHELRDKDNKLEEKENKLEELQDELENREDKEEETEEEEDNKLTKDEVNELLESQEEKVMDSINAKMDIVKAIEKVDNDYEPNLKKDAIELQRDFIKRVDENVEFDGKSDGYIEAKFEMLLDAVKENEGRTITMKPDGDSGKPSKIDELRNQRIEKFQG